MWYRNKYVNKLIINGANLNYKDPNEKKKSIFVKKSLGSAGSDR